MKLFLKLFPSLTFWGIFIYVILQVPYPENITQANLNQLFSFFIPLFLAITFSLNIFLKNVFISGSIALGLIFILIIQALHSLNLVSGGLIIISIGLLISYFKKNKKRDLTNLSKIPKLTKLRR